MAMQFIENFQGQAQPRAALLESNPVSGFVCPEGNIAHLLLRAAKTDRGIVFVKDEHQELRYSYQDLLELALCRLGSLRQLGLKRGDPVMLMFRESQDFVISFWAAVLGGMIPAPLAYPAALNEDNAVLSKLKSVWEQMDRPIILSDSLLVERQGQIQMALADQRFTVVAVSGLVDTKRVIEPDLAEPDSLALIQYSSGSTGNPKGVMLSHANLIANLEGIINGTQMTKADTVISWMPYHHDMGLIGFHLTPVALANEQVNLLPFTFVRKPGLWLDKIQQHQASITGSPNFGYRHLLSKLKPEQVKRWDLSCLRLIFNGAEPISTSVIEEFMAALAPCGLKPGSMFTVFGMAEACLAVSFPPVGSIPRVHWLDRQSLAKGQTIVKAEPGSNQAIAIVDEGYPVTGCKIRIVDKDDHVLQEGEIGHVHIGGANVTLGYYQNPSATDGCIRNGWLDTGDLGFVIDGRLCISGRDKDIIFVNGQNYYAHDIEAQMDKVPGIEPGKTAACGWQDPESGTERTAVFIALRRPEDDVNLSLLKSVWQTISENLGISLDFVVPVKNIPKTTSGKTQRYKLLEEFQSGLYQNQTKNGQELAEFNPNTGSSSTETEPDMLELVRSVWAQVLAIPLAQVGLEQTYRALGGTSIKAVEILGLLETRLDREVDHELLLRCQTVQQMADWLSIKTKPINQPPIQTASCSDEPIAIIGLSCRFPGSNSPEEFWENLSLGRDLIGPVPADRFLPPNGGREDWWRGGFVTDVYGFDAEFFGISAEEATDMDPQQRMFLEVAAETLERAGYSRPALNGADVGLFIGASHNNHMEFLVNAMSGESLADFASLRRLDPAIREELLQEWQDRFGEFSPNANTAVDNLLNMIAARVSHTFNWKGPSMTIDSACSSSLVAVHLASQSLRLGECSMAIAGGVSLTLSPTPYLLFKRAGALSPSGRCRVFDSAADGFVLGEGAGAVLLKPLSKALADGDPVLAVLRGSAVNNDGQSLGVMAPNPDGQRRVMAAVYRQSGISPATVQYVEAHGTGTPLGDPSEVRALSQVYADLPQQSCAIGSVKANIGHLLSAAGIASLIKVVMAIKHQTLPGNVNLAQANTQIDFGNSPFLPLTSNRSWPEPADAPRRAAINSFGFGGTNCHLLIEAPAPLCPKAEAWPTHMLLLSAPNIGGLSLWAKRIADYLQQTPELNLGDVCATINYARNQYAYRIPLVCTGPEEMLSALQNLSGQQAHELREPAKVGLLFTGQGAQYPGMGAFLMAHWPRFKTIMQEIDAAFQPWLAEPLLDSIYLPEASAGRLASTDLTQPAMFAIDYALGRSLLELGVKPAALIGHSVGEYAAACLAGCFSLSDAAKLVAARGRLMAALPKQGGMYAVFTGIAELSQHLQAYQDRIWFAAHNGSHQVIAGYSDALAELAMTLESANIRVKPLAVSHAFHTPLLNPMLQAFAEVLAEVNFQAPQLPLISNISGDWYGTQIPDAEYWLRHVLAPVRFEQSIRTAYASGVKTFVECGPDKVLSNLAASILVGEPVSISAMLDRRRDAGRTLPEALGSLWAQGVDLKQTELQADFPGRRIPLPAYPFNRKTFRLGPTPSHRPTVPSPSLLHRWVWQASPIGSGTSSSHGTTLVFVGDGEAAWLQALQEQLGTKRTILPVRPGREFSVQADGFLINPDSADNYLRLWQTVREHYPEPIQVIHCWNAQPIALASTEHQALHAGVFSFAYLAKAVTQYSSGPVCQILWVSRRAHALDHQDTAPDPYQLSAINFALGCAAEEPKLMVQTLDLDAIPAPDSIEVNTIAAELNAAEFAGSIISIRGGQRFQRYLENIDGLPASNKVLLADGGTCLITGGSTGIGAQTALFLARSARVNLVLTGRTALPERASWDLLSEHHPAAPRIALLRQLETLGATVCYHVADAADAEAMAEVLKQLYARFGQVDGVIHCAGVVDRKHFRATDKTVNSMQAVFSAKLKGTRLLHELTVNQPLKFFILYSSISASGADWAASLSDYSAANAYLDGFAEWRSRIGAPGRSLALNWSLWAGLGMGSDLGLQALTHSKGLRALSADTAQRALNQAMAITDAAVVHVIDFEPEPAPMKLSLMTKQPPSIPVPELAEPSPSQYGHVATVNPALAGSSNWLAQVRTLLAQCLDCSLAEVEASKKFQDMGLESRGAVEVSEALGAMLGQAVMPTLLFEFQTPLDLAAYLENRYGNSCFESLVSPAKAEHIPQLTTAPVIKASTPKHSSKPDADDQAIAIVGMGLRIPGAKNAEEYWSMLAEGRSMIKEVPAERWSANDFFDAANTQASKTYSKWGAFIDQPYDFDAQFFGISPREAKVMDPQQRIFMEVAYEALQQAGYGGEGKASKLGIFVGCEQNYFGSHFINLQYYRQLQDRLKQQPWYKHLSTSARQEWDEALRDVLKPAEVVSDVVAGNGLNEIACRLSHWMNVRGPSLVVNTACSAALVALHLACQSLRNGESKVAVAGGAYLNMGATPFVFLSRVNAMSPDGSCRPFDRGANGLVLGEGISALVLKPLSAAMADGDPIHGLIMGSAMNNDGHSSGLIAPNPAGQAECISRAYLESGISPESVSYVECHGTGTALGDPVEVDGMTQAFRQFTKEQGYCGIGSVKSSIGHMLSAAGIPSIIKVLLAMKHEHIPATVNYAEANPYIDFNNSPFYVVGSGGRDWRQNDSVPRVAGVNGFGFGGTNCHVILQEPPRYSGQASGLTFAKTPEPNLLCLTARTDNALRQYAKSLYVHINSNPSLSAGQVVLSLNSSQREMNKRAAAGINGRQELLEVLSALADGQNHAKLITNTANPKQPKTCHWCFDDQAWPSHAASSLAGQYPVYAESWSEFRAAIGQQLNPVLESAAEQYALAKLLVSLELTPTSLHASGKSLATAAAAAGWISPAAAVALLSGGDLATSPQTELIPVLNCPIGDLRSNSPDLIGHIKIAMQTPATPPPSSGLLLGLGGNRLDGQHLQLISGQAVTENFLQSLAGLYVEGHKPNLNGLMPKDIRKVVLPTYPFEHKTFLFDGPAQDREVKALNDSSPEPQPPSAHTSLVFASAQTAQLQAPTEQSTDFGKHLLAELQQINWVGEFENEKP